MRQDWPGQASFPLCFLVVFLDDWGDFARRVDERRVCVPMHGLLLSLTDHGEDAQLRFAGAMFWFMWKRSRHSAVGVVVRIRRGDDATPHRFGHGFDRVAHCVLLCWVSPRIRTQAFPKRSLSTGLAQKASCSSERREIMTRRNSLDEVRELLTHGLIGKSTGQGVERPKFQPARPLRGGDLDGTA